MFKKYMIVENEHAQRGIVAIKKENSFGVLYFNKNLRLHTLSTGINKYSERGWWYDKSGYSELDFVIITDQSLTEEEVLILQEISNDIKFVKKENEKGIIETFVERNCDEVNFNKALKAMICGKAALSLKTNIYYHRNNLNAILDKEVEGMWEILDR